MKANITIDNFRNLYFQMPKGQRSIRRLHKDLKEKYKNKKTLPSLATIFRYSKKENWIEQSTIVDSRANEKAMEKIVDKKAVELEQITNQLKETSTLALDKVLDALKRNVGTDITKPEQILTMVKAGTEASKLANLLQGNPTSISGHVAYDSEDVTKLKEHIKELYASINADLVQQKKDKLN